MFQFRAPVPLQIHSARGHPREFAADLMVSGEVVDNRQRDFSLIGMDEAWMSHGSVLLRGCGVADLTDDVEQVDAAAFEHIMSAVLSQTTQWGVLRNSITGVRTSTPPPLLFSSQRRPPTSFSNGVQQCRSLTLRCSLISRRAATLLYELTLISPSMPRLSLSRSVPRCRGVAIPASSLAGCGDWDTRGAGAAAVAQARL